MQISTRCIFATRVFPLVVLYSNTETSKSGNTRIWNKFLEIFQGIGISALQVGSSGNDFDVYLGGDWLESRPGNRLSAKRIVVFFSASRKTLGYFFELSHNNFLTYHDQIIIQCHPAVRYYIFRTTDASVNKPHIYTHVVGP